MTDEKFYKNTLTTLINMQQRPLFLQLTNDIREHFPEIEFNIDLNGFIKNLKRKLIIKEKTWYKTRNDGRVYIIGCDPYIKNLQLKIVGKHLDTEQIFSFNSDGSYFHTHESILDLVSECTPEEVKKIEEALMKKNQLIYYME
jgi:hypothetical protein